MANKPFGTSEKYIRRYRLIIQKQDTAENDFKPTTDAIIIENPIGISFSIERGIYAQVQTMDISIYNLNDVNRDLLFRDVYKRGEFLYIRLEAGYLNMGLSCIFEGFVWSAYSKRVGVNVVTQIKAITNLGASESYVNLTLGNNSTTQDIVDACMEAMPMYSKGTMVFNNQTFPNGVTLADNPITILKKYADVDVYIDMMTVNLLPNSYAISNLGIPKYTLSETNGLLGTPERQDAILTIRMIFEPRIAVGQLITISSSVAPQFNGTFRIFSIHHEGDINDASTGQLITTIKVNVPSQINGAFTSVFGTNYT